MTLLRAGTTGGGGGGGGCEIGSGKSGIDATEDAADCREDAVCAIDSSDSLPVCGWYWNTGVWSWILEPSSIEGTLLGRGGLCGGCDFPGGGRYGAASDELTGAAMGPGGSGHWGIGVGRDIDSPPTCTSFDCDCDVGGASLGIRDGAPGSPAGRLRTGGWATCGGCNGGRGCCGCFALLGS